MNPQASPAAWPTITIRPASQNIMRPQLGGTAAHGADGVELPASLEDQYG